MRAIVCIAHERENTVLPYIISVTVSHLYGLFSLYMEFCLYQLICRVNQYEYGRECGVCSTQNLLPDQNFQFSIFNFQLKISNFSYIAVHQMSAEIFIQKSLQW